MASSDNQVDPHGAPCLSLLLPLLRGFCGWGTTTWKFLLQYLCNERYKQCQTSSRRVWRRIFGLFPLFCIFDICFPDTDIDAERVFGFQAAHRLLLVVQTPGVGMPWDLWDAMKGYSRAVPKQEAAVVPLPRQLLAL